MLVVLGCGSDDDFANDPRPPLPIELTGVIQSGKLTVSPTKFGAGPVLITISNQTDDPHTVTLSGGAIKGARVGPVEPANTASIQRTLEPGDYEVSAGGEAAVEREIKPATLAVGAERESSSGDLSLP
ncbi:MAG: hypothetical protein H0U84_00770 [Thermoleophilaceae bacterium]|nr:hypothetical protein [Thermoleophilaceae bacterium]